MAKIVKINHPFYGDVEFNVNRVLAVVPERHELLFESAIWKLEKDEFEKVYDIWNQMK